MPRQDASMEEWFFAGDQNTIVLTSDFAPVQLTVSDASDIDLANMQLLTSNIDDLLAERVLAAIGQFQDAVAFDPSVRGGVAVLRGTRMPLSTIFAELADDQSLTRIAEDYELDASQIESMLGALSMYLERPLRHDPLPVGQVLQRPQALH